MRLVCAGNFSATAQGTPSLPGIGAFDPVARTWMPLAAIGQTVVSMCANAAGDLFVAAGAQVYRWQSPSWQPLGSGMNGAVSSLVALANGDVLAAGAFTTAGGAAAAGFARWNGAAWSSTGLGVQAVGRTLACAPNGDVLASGRFTLGGVAAEHVARWDGFFWHVLGPAFDQPVTCLLAVTDTDFVAAGDFTLVGASPANRIARWQGTSWQQVGAGLGATPYTLANEGAHFLVGGAFSQIGGAPVGYLARWDGTAWQPYREGMNGSVRTSVRMPDGELHIGGDFTLADRVTVQYLARWDGQRWQCVGEGRQPLPVSNARAILPFADGRMVVGGQFAQGPGLNYIAYFDGESWQAMGSGLNGAVRAVVALPGGDVVAGGDFTATYDNAVALPRVARWNGTAWSAVGNLSTLYGLAVHPSGDLYAAGYSNQFGWGVFRWTGATWQPIGATPANGEVSAIAIAANGDLVVAGSFQSIGGVATGTVARWNGTTWSGVGANGQSMGSVAVAPTGDVYAGARGNNYYGYLWRWDGFNWQQHGPVSYSYADVAVGALPNGDALVGVWQPYNQSYLSRFSPIGGWQSIPCNGPVYCTQPFGRDEAHIGGSFDTVNNVRAYNVARFRTTCPATATATAAGCSGPNGQPTLAFRPDPWVGLTCQSRTTGLSASAFVFTVYGFDTVNVPLAAISPYAAPACVLMPALDVVDLQVPFAGEVYSSLVIPNNAALAGATLHHQTVQFEVDQTPAPLSLNASNALRLVVGVF